MAGEVGSKTNGDEEAWTWVLAALDRLRQGLSVDASESMIEVPGWPEWIRLYWPLLQPGALVLGQLGQTLDGRIATISGHSHYVTGEPDRQHLHRLRALVDAVIVGAGTLCADNPRLTVRMVQGPQPVRVVLDPRGRMPLGSEVLQDGAAPTLWLRTVADLDSNLQPHVEVLCLPEISPGGGFAPASVLELLRSRGLQRVLVEGGGLTVSRFLQDGVLDRLFLTLAPMLLGSGRPSITLEPVTNLAQALRPKTRIFRLGEDTLFDLELRSAGS